MMRTRSFCSADILKPSTAAMTSADFFLAVRWSKDAPVSRVYDIRIQEVILNRRCGFTKHIGQDGIQRRIAHSESILEAISFTGTHGDELVTVSGKLAQHTNLLVGN